MHMHTHARTRARTHTHTHTHRVSILTVSYCPLLLLCSAASLTPAVAVMPLVSSLRAVAVWIFIGLAVRGGAGPKVLASRATALVTADDVSSCPLLSAVGSFRLSAGARPSGKKRFNKLYLALQQDTDRDDEESFVRNIRRDDCETVRPALSPPSVCWSSTQNFDSCRLWHRSVFKALHQMWNCCPSKNTAPRYDCCPATTPCCHASALCAYCHYLMTKEIVMTWVTLCSDSLDLLMLQDVNPAGYRRFTDFKIWMGQLQFLIVNHD